MVSDVSTGRPPGVFGAKARRRFHVSMNVVCDQGRTPARFAITHRPARCETDARPVPSERENGARRG